MTFNDTEEMLVEGPLVSLDLIFGNMRQKQIICVHIADVKHEQFSCSFMK